MTRENGEQVSKTEGDVADSPRKRLKDSVQEYHQPFEPVGIEDWEVLDLRDDTGTPRGSA